MRIRPVLLGWLLLAPALFGTPAPPDLRFHSPEKLLPLARELEKFDPSEFLRTMELVGLEEAGPPIPVHLALEGSGAARRAPRWSVAYARGGQVVLLPSRVPGYPNRHIETVLHHEVAHILIARAAGGRAVPRWFHEGLALYTARDWGLEDRSRVLWATLRGRDSTLEALNGQFGGGAHAASRAYAFSAAFVRYLLDQYGEGAPAEILAGVAGGAPFEEAFRRATRVSLQKTEERFFRHLDFWNKWVPFLTSSTTLWILISTLAVYAFKRRRDRDAELRAKWEAEELALLERAEVPGAGTAGAGGTGPWIH